MAIYSYDDLMSQIEAIVYDNTTKAVTAEKLQQLFKDVVDSSVNLEYDTNRSYEPGAFCVYENAGTYKAYVCIAPTSGAFAGGDWTQIGV